MSDPKPSLPKSIQRQFAPTLRRDGFAGTSQRYWRLIGGQCQVIEVQGSRYGGQFAVNMGIQPLSVPLRTGEALEPRHLREVDCLFGRRLTRGGSDQWWAYQPNQTSMDAAASAACNIYEEVGRSQFECMAQPESHLRNLTPDAFAARSFDFKGFGNTGGLMAWGLAHMRKAAGNLVEAKQFAQIALQEIGDGAVGLRAELRELVESIQTQQYVGDI